MNAADGRPNPWEQDRNTRTPRAQCHGAFVCMYVLTL